MRLSQKPAGLRNLGMGKTLPHETEWARVGAILQHRTTRKRFKVVAHDDPRWFLESYSEGEIVGYYRGDLALFFEEVPFKTRFERIQDH